MLNFKIKENPVVDLALVPSPLIIIEMLFRKRLKERIVVANDNATKNTTENTESKRCSQTCELETSLLRC
jgi:hypothetical protein